jgi:hypothetical protein
MKHEAEENTTQYEEIITNAIFNLTENKSEHILRKM